MEESTMKNSLNGSWVLTAALLVSLAGCANTRTHESTGGSIDEVATTTKVMAEMVADKQMCSPY
jgi:hypothetical protein